MQIYRANLIDTPTKDAFRIIEHGFVVVNDNGQVVGVYDQLPAEYINQPITDYGDKLLIPAFNDLHLHAPQYRNSGIAMDLELLPWLNTYTFPEESKFSDQAYAKRVYSRFVHDLWKQGTMRSAVFATIHPQATRILADLFLKAGMGALVGQVGMDRNGPDTLSNTTEEIVSGVRDLYTYLQENGQDGLVRPIVTPRFVPSCTPEMMQALGDLAKELNLPVQSHLSENRGEVAWVKDLEPQSTCYGDAYNHYGLFGQQPTLMAHCCYTDGEEMELMKRNQVVVVHCPTSNCNLASGMAPIRMFMNEGIPVAIGSDISGGHDLSIPHVLQYVIQISKLQYARTQGELKFLSLNEAFYLATKAGGAFFGKVGSFEPGYEFDALVIDDSDLNYDNYTLQQRLERFIYLGDDRQIKVRFCRGHELCEPVIY